MHAPFLGFLRYRLKADISQILVEQSCFFVIILYIPQKISCARPTSKIKSPLYSRYYVEACNEWRGPSPRFSAWAFQLRRNVAAVARCW